MPDFSISPIHLFYRCRFGLKHLFARMITFYLDQIEGEKIIFAFSNPSAAAIEAISDRQSQGSAAGAGQDIVGLICDSGPSRPFVRSAWNLAVQIRGEYKLLGLFSLLWSLRSHQDIRSQLKNFPASFPILSIRGGSDEVIPPWHIDLVFKGLNKQLQIEVAEIPEAGHLNALKRFPEIYRDILTTWLRSITTE